MESSEGRKCRYLLAHVVLYRQVLEGEGELVLTQYLDFPG